MSEQTVSYHNYCEAHMSNSVLPIPVRVKEKMECIDIAWSECPLLRSVHINSLMVCNDSLSLSCVLTRCSMSAFLTFL